MDKDKLTEERQKRQQRLLENRAGRLEAFLREGYGYDGKGLETAVLDVILDALYLADARGATIDLDHLGELAMSLYPEVGPVRDASRGEAD